MRKILIFGGNGFVGRYLAVEFKNNGYQVIATSRSECNEQLKQYIDIYRRADLLDYTAVESLISETNPDYIINLAAVSSVGASWAIPQRTIEVNVNGTLNILEAVRKLEINPKILLVGSSEEYYVSTDRISETYPINANNPYGISKVTQEHFSEIYRKEYGLRIINTRTFNHTGVGQPDLFAIPSFVKQVAEIHKKRKSGIIRVGNLSARRDLGDVRDMASAYRAILEGESNSNVFNVGSGTCYCLEDILKYIISLTPYHIDIIVDKEKLRPLDNPIIWCDNTLLRSEFNWNPQYSIYDAINAMFEFYISNDD